MHEQETRGFTWVLVQRAGASPSTARWGERQRAANTSDGAEVSVLLLHAMCPSWAQLQSEAQSPVPSSWLLVVPSSVIEPSKCTSWELAVLKAKPLWFCHGKTGCAAAFSLSGCSGSDTRGLRLCGEAEIKGRGPASCLAGQGDLQGLP